MTILYHVGVIPLSKPEPAIDHGARRVRRLRPRLLSENKKPFGTYGF